MLVAHLWPVLCVQEWNEKYTALKTLFMIHKFSLIGMWQYGNDERNVHLSNISFKLQSLSQGHHMSLYLDTLARTSAPELARRGRVCAALAVTEGGRRDSVTAPRTRDMSWVLCLVAAHKQQTQHFQCFHNNSQHFYGHWAVLYLHTYSKVPSKIQQTTTARYQSLVNCLECLRIET